jgi:hypothetical protein
MRHLSAVNGFTTAKQLNFNNHGLQPVVNGCAGANNREAVELIVIQYFHDCRHLNLYLPPVAIIIKPLRGFHCNK